MLYIRRSFYNLLILLRFIDLPVVIKPMVSYGLIFLGLNLLFLFSFNFYGFPWNIV